MHSPSILRVIFALSVSRFLIYPVYFFFNPFVKNFDQISQVNVEFYISISIMTTKANPLFINEEKGTQRNYNSKSSDCDAEATPCIIRPSPFTLPPVFSNPQRYAQPSLCSSFSHSAVRCFLPYPSARRYTSKEHTEPKCIGLLHI